MSTPTLSPAQLIQYREDGCHLHDHCLSCPLAKCYFDEERIDEDLGEQVREMRAQGATVNEVAVALGIKRRWVFYLSARGKAS